MKDKIMIKPLSVNEAYASTYPVGKSGKVRRVKSKKYKEFLDEMMALLPNGKLTKEPYKIHYEFGFSSKACDLDNAVKTTQDVLQWKCGFNDNKIYYSSQEKIIVPKGEEYIQFSISTYEKYVSYNCKNCNDACKVEKNLTPCRGCGAEPLSHHVSGCDWEGCTLCSEQYAFCGCEPEIREYYTGRFPDTIEALQKRLCIRCYNKIL